jgi:hypothetical protein
MQIGRWVSIRKAEGLLKIRTFGICQGLTIIEAIGHDSWLDEEY